MTEIPAILAIGSITLVKIAAIIAGAYIVSIGGKLVASGARGEFKFNAKISDKTSIGLVSLSPGLLFALVGTLLIGWAIFVDKSVTRTVSGAAAIQAPAFPSVEEN